MATEAIPIIPIATEEPRSYKDLDFRSLYEQEHGSHQETKRELRISQDRVEYLAQRLKESEGQKNHLAKLLFERKSEKKTTQKKSPKTIPNLL